MDLVAVGRTAEVFGLDSDRVLKLDRLEWNGVSHFEAGVLRAAHAAGLPVPEVFEAVNVDGRHGIVLERIRGTSLTEFLASGAEIDKRAERFIDLHQELQAIELPGLPELVPRLDDEIKRSGLHAERCDELRERLPALAQDEVSRVCHFDLHPDNIIISGRRWIVIDWLTAANGPPIADFARTLLLRANSSDPIMRSFADALRHYARDRRGFDDAAVRAWMQVLAAARLAEGFDGPYAEWLVGLATNQQS